MDDSQKKLQVLEIGLISRNGSFCYLVELMSSKIPATSCGNLNWKKILTSDETEKIYRGIMCTKCMKNIV